MRAEETLRSGMRELERLRDLLRWRVRIARTVEVAFVVLAAAALAAAGAMAQLYAGWWILPVAVLAGGVAYLRARRAAVPGLSEAALFADRAAGLQGYAVALLELERSPLSQADGSQDLAAQMRADFLTDAAGWLPRLAVVRVGLTPARMRLLLLPLSLLLAQGLLWMALTQDAGRNARDRTAPDWMLQPVAAAIKPGQTGAVLSQNDPAALRAAELARRLEELRALSERSPAAEGMAGAAGSSARQVADGTDLAGHPVAEYGGADPVGTAVGGQLRGQGEIPPAYARQVDAYLRARDQKSSR